MRTDPRLDWGKVTAIATLVIALSAVALSMWQGFETRLNNRLSVRPRLQVHVVRTPEPRYSQQTPGLYVRNAGLGPAVIRKILVRTGGRSFDGSSGGLASTLVAEKLGITDFVRLETRGFPADMVLRAGEEVPFIRIAEPSYTATQSAAVCAAIETIEMNLEYESMYGEGFSSAFRTR